MAKHYKLFIGGKWVAASDGFFPSLNPATEKPLAVFQRGSEMDVRKAVKAAEDALPKWKSIPAPKRGDLLLRVAQILRKRKEELSRILTMEMGKVLPEARGDVQEAIDITEYMAGEGRRLFGHTTPSELREKFAMSMRMPIGVCGLIAPWNFPFAIPAWKIMPALICGNTVVFKPSSDTPLCATELVKILIEAGLPKGVVNLVTGPGSTAGAELVKNPGVRGLSFTGNRSTGEWILKNAGIKKVGLELGGKNAIMVMDDADLKLALDGVIWGGFGTTGQRCTATSRVIVHEKVKKKFEKLLLKKTLTLRLGNGLSLSTDVGPLINRKAVEKSHTYSEIGIGEGAKLLCGGQAPKGRGYFYKPTLFTDVKPGMRIAQEEIFGPVISIIPFSGLDEGIEIMNGIEYGLSSAIYTQDVNKAFEAIEQIEAGLTYVNSSTIGSEVHLPFGGVKGTGYTREAGVLGLEEFSSVKTIYVDYSGKLQRAQIDI
jgi:aldehyde dehydrogenase (NAD+)